MHKNSTPSKVSWTVADLIDFEILMAEDETIPSERHNELKERDRSIYCSLKSQGATPSDAARGWWVRRWLDARRKERFPGDFTPGEEVSSLFVTLQFVLFIVGLLTARAMVWSSFHEAKINAIHPEPINVIEYGIVCIGFTFVLSLCGFWALFSNHIVSKLPKLPTIARSVLLCVLKPLLKQIAHRISDGLTAERRLRVKEISGALKKGLIMRKDGISVALLCHVQIFGLSFACGVLLFSGYDLAVASRIFGWQTTLFSADASMVHACLRAISAPWLWIAPEGIGLPSLEHVQGTQFFVTHDLSAFPREAAKVWGMFVVFAAFVYGVIPRAAFYLLSKRQLSRVLSELDFEDPRSDLLMDRLMTLDPIWDPGPEKPFVIPLSFPLPPDAPSTGGPCTVILRSDVNVPGIAESIAGKLRQKGWQVGENVILPESPKATSRIIENLPKSRAYLVHDSCSHQVGEVMDLMSEIRESIGPKKAVILSLVGKPDGTPLGNPPLASEVDVWSRMVNAAGDPYLGVTTFLPPQ